jgi:hypothetical protein
MGTWVAELQNGGEFNNEDAVSWVYKSPANGSRSYHSQKQMEPMGIKSQDHCCGHYDRKARDRNRRARQRARNGGSRRM